MPVFCSTQPHRPYWAQSDLSLDCLYVHAPARNISIARNACLDAADAPLIAFIDDDETATGEHDDLWGIHAAAS
jgi:hypothetical protein